MADDTETLATRAEKADAELHEAIMEGAGPLATECQDLIMQLAAANARLERERDALLDEWREIAGGLTTDEPEIGALWPMVAEVSGSLSAVRLHFKNEVGAHNATKAERDAATSALAKAERERDRMQEALRKIAGSPAWTGRVAIARIAEAALTPAPEAPKDGE